MSRKVKAEEIETSGTALVPWGATLTGPQENALLVLLTGRTQRDAAAEIGVAEETVSRWIHQDAVFVAEWNRRRQDLWAARRERLRDLGDKAVNALADLLDSDRDTVRLRAALAILTALQPDAPTGPTTPDEVNSEWQHEANFKELLESCLV